MLLMPDTFRRMIQQEFCVYVRRDQSPSFLKRTHSTLSELSIFNHLDMHCDQFRYDQAFNFHPFGNFTAV